METTPIPYDYADRIYDLLVADAGANADSWERQLFIRYMTEGSTREYRCCGRFGFGGKFWNYLDRWYVTAYSDEEKRHKWTKDIETVNVKLAVLNAEWKASR